MSFKEWYDIYWPPEVPRDEGRALIAWKSARVDLLPLLGGAADVMEKYSINERWKNIITELRKVTE